MQFLDNGVAIGTPQTLDGSGVATLPWSTLTGGTHSITAAYTSDNQATFGDSVSPAYSQVVNPAATSATLGATPSSPVFGQPVTLTATITSSAGIPTGTVTFLDNNVSIGTGTLNGSGVATLVTSTLGAGSHPLTASYATDGNFAASTSGIVTLNVGQANTTTRWSPPPTRRCSVSR